MGAEPCQPQLSRSTSIFIMFTTQTVNSVRPDRETACIPSQYPDDRKCCRQVTSTLFNAKKAKKKRHQTNSHTSHDFRDELQRTLGSWLVSVRLIEARS